MENVPPTHDPAILDTWGKQGADCLDPLAFHYLQALHRRAQAQGGTLRSALQDRLADGIGAYAAALARAGQPAANAEPARSALGELTDELAARAAARNGGKTAATTPLPELPVLEDFRKLWSQVRSDSQVRRSLEPLSNDAGPLNSGRLVHRSLQLMQELSPGYLQHFLDYVDALSWLEHMSAGQVLAVADAPARDSGKPRTRKPRKRRE
ncbi:DUF2894 domain-containing protein [Lysobacter silvisoli]|uniref:DUF2894 domain-containing protein n=1 Tax=Lysobacter silvisoli TaxID=2293254 RepID=A0A371K742_9GAMM|nr:DUF2894 domain-containing protein [Lysobacter silvisoli]